MLWIDLLWPLVFAALAVAVLPQARWPRPGALLRPETVLLLLPGLVALGGYALADLTTEDELSSLRDARDPAIYYLVRDKGLPSRLHRFWELLANLTVGQALVRAVHVGGYLLSGALLVATARRWAGGLGLILSVVVLWDPIWLEYTWESRAHAQVLALSTVAACAMAEARHSPHRTGHVSTAVAALSLASLDNPIAVLGLLAVGAVVLAHRWGSRGARLRWMLGGVLLGIGLLATVLPALANHGTRPNVTPEGGLWFWLRGNLRDPQNLVGLLPLVTAAALLPGPGTALARVALLGFGMLLVPIATGTLPLQLKVVLWWAPWMVLAAASLVPPTLRRLPSWAALLLLAPLALRPAQETGLAAMEERQEALAVLEAAPGGARVVPEFARTRLVSALVSTRWSRTPDLWQRVPPAWARPETLDESCPEQGLVVVDARYEVCQHCTPVVTGHLHALRRCGPVEPEPAP